MEVNIIRIIFLLFVLFRPKFLDDDKYAIPFNKLITRNKEFTYHNFEFVFYSHYYYLRQDANLDDLALMLNTSKNELSNFLNNEMKQNFTELLNKNRVIYFENLLLDKKFESFTIEALSEMSGFNNRRTMYNAFKKHIGITPSEYLLRFK